MDESDGDIFEEMSRKHPHLLNKIYTPLTRVHLDPVSEKKTPATSLESPWTNIDRYEINNRPLFKNLWIWDSAILENIGKNTEK